MQAKKCLAVFDFDNTITTKDTLPDFLIFTFGGARFVVGILRCSIDMALFLLGVVSNQKAKEHLFVCFFRNLPVKDMIEKGNRYADTRLPLLISSEADARIRFHRSQGDTLAIVSASPKYWFQSWAAAHGFEKIISTELEIKESLLTGKMSGNNCYGQEKVARLKRELDLEEYDGIVAYGDSKGDEEMLTLADEGYYKFKRIK